MTAVDDRPDTSAEIGKSRTRKEDARLITGRTKWTDNMLPVLRLRLAAPELVIDLHKVEGLTGVRDDGDHIVIGAMTTHDEVSRDPLVRQHALLLALASETVADPQVRHRGTFGGALAHADPRGRPARPRTGPRGGVRHRGGRRCASHGPGGRLLRGPVHHRDG